MWSEWLARTLKRPRTPEAAVKRADAAVAAASDEHGSDAACLAARERARAARYEDSARVSADLL